MSYLKNSTKSQNIKKLIEEALKILDVTGIPLAKKTPRSLERMAMAFLAVSGVKTSWQDIKTTYPQEQRFLKTREIIAFINEHFEENISSGSYDDIRRKDLKLLVLQGIVINSAENKKAATNDPTRGYTLSDNFHNLLLTYQTPHWDKELASYLEKEVQLKEKLDRTRNLDKVSITLELYHFINQLVRYIEIPQSSTYANYFII